jgi:hypothetical protein
MIDSAYFLPNHDDWCYAYNADAPNDRKYARTSLLLDRLATKYGIKWDFEELSKTLMLEPNSYVGNAYVAWARFQPVKNLRQKLKDKVYQVMTSKNLSPDEKAEVYAEVTTTLITLGAKMPEDKDNTVKCNPQKEWARTALQQNDLDLIIDKLKLRVDSEQFLASIPSKTG